MDLQDQLKNLFPDHIAEEEETQEVENQLWMQDDPLICKYEKEKEKQRPLSKAIQAPMMISSN